MLLLKWDSNTRWSFKPLRGKTYLLTCSHNENSNQLAQPRSFITKIRLFKFIENFTSKNWNFSDKNSESFHISAQNIDWVYSLEPPCRGGSNEYTQSMFLSKNKKKMYTHVNSSFNIWKWGLRGSKLYRHVFVIDQTIRCPRADTLHPWLSKICPVNSD